MNALSERHKGDKYLDVMAFDCQGPCWRIRKGGYACVGRVGGQTAAARNTKFISSFD